MRKNVFGVILCAVGLIFVIVATWAAFTVVNSGVERDGVSGDSGSGDSDSAYDAVATNFIGYDTLRAVLGEDSRVKMLVAPGSGAHDYEPTPADIVEIQNSQVFVYNGGEDEEWVSELLKKNEISSTRTVGLLELINSSKLTNDDEHVWTSVPNMISLVSGVRDKLSSLFPESAKKYAENASSYIERLQGVDAEIRKAVSEGARKTLYFGDRFPFSYFVREYGLEYLSAIPGCDEHTEVDPKTLSELISAMKEAGAKVVLKLELSSNKIAQTVSEETGAKVLEFSSAHNVSKEDFETGVTYVDILERNLGVLREALR